MQRPAFVKLGMCMAGNVYRITNYVCKHEGRLSQGYKCIAGYCVCVQTSMNYVTDEGSTKCPGLRR